MEVLRETFVSLLDKMRRSLALDESAVMSIMFIDLLELKLSAVKLENDLFVDDGKRGVANASPSDSANSACFAMTLKVAPGGDLELTFVLGSWLGGVLVPCMGAFRLVLPAKVAYLKKVAERRFSDTVFAVIGRN